MPASYLDHNASQPLRPAARQALLAALEGEGNASSVHGFGRGQRRRLERARAEVAALAGWPPAGVVFTSGATEANNLALKGLPAASLLLGGGEHPSVLAAAPGARRLPLTSEGLVEAAVLAAALAELPAPTLVALQAANNETGVIQPLAQLAPLVRQAGGWLHVDAVQAAGRLPPELWAAEADSLALSAHKLGGPQGAGALLLARDTPLAAQLAGGGQERRRRAGTEPVALLAGFGAAAAAAAAAQSAEAARLLALRERLEAGLRRIEARTVIFGEAAPRLPNTTAFAVPGVAAETALAALDLAGVALSSGSACSSGKVEPSHVLAAMGVAPGLARCALRASLGWSTTAAEVDRFLAVWESHLARLEPSAA
jgi:cysteine desulfurase